MTAAWGSKTLWLVLYTKACATNILFAIKHNFQRKAAFYLFPLFFTFLVLSCNIALCTISFVVRTKNQAIENEVVWTCIPVRGCSLFLLLSLSRSSFFINPFICFWNCIYSHSSSSLIYFSLFLVIFFFCFFFSDIKMRKSNKNSFAILIGVLMPYGELKILLNSNFKWLFPETYTVWCMREWFDVYTSIIIHIKIFNSAYKSIELLADVWFVITSQKVLRLRIVNDKSQSESIYLVSSYFPSHWNAIYNIIWHFKGTSNDLKPIFYANIATHIHKCAVDEHTHQDHRFFLFFRLWFPNWEKIVGNNLTVGNFSFAAVFNFISSYIKCAINGMSTSVRVRVCAPRWWWNCAVKSTKKSDSTSQQHSVQYTRVRNS